MKFNRLKFLIVGLLLIVGISVIFAFYNLKQSTDSGQRILELQSRIDFLEKENEILIDKSNDVEPSNPEDPEINPQKVSVFDVNTTKAENANATCYIEHKSDIQVDKSLSNVICQFLLARTVEVSGKRDIFISFNGQANSIVSGSTLQSPFLFRVSGTNVEVIFERNDSPLCSEIDGLGIASLYSKCLDTSGTVRETKN